ncbi:MAG: PadR family transcriptional regulator [Saprospiraceae bacterium]|nr:PadR family transcriptional regulator [Saprospiraceae bacterium]MDW8484993.1 PadR family transcriptional regulator [Saprospiraceae bacterium]
MDIENAKAQMRKGVLEMCVLAVVSERETYPPEIIERLAEVNLPMKEGTLYPLLMRLKGEGLVDYVWREGIKGPPRKYFTITEKGRVFLRALTSSWHALVKAVNQTLAFSGSNPSVSAEEPPPLLNVESPRPTDDECAS